MFEPSMSSDSNMRFRNRILVHATVLATLLHAAIVAAATIVPGATDPNLAGRADGYSCCGGDTAPQVSPVLVAEPDFSVCDVLNFSVTGSVSYLGAATSGNNPDGDSGFSMLQYGDGISAPQQVRVDALVGVFLGDDAPTGQATPEALSFAPGLGFTWLAPAI